MQVNIKFFLKQSYNLKLINRWVWKLDKKRTLKLCPKGESNLPVGSELLQYSGRPVTKDRNEDFKLQYTINKSQIIPKLQ